jgi:hypothetical protein
MLLETIWDEIKSTRTPRSCSETPLPTKSRTVISGFSRLYKEDVIDNNRNNSDIFFIIRPSNIVYSIMRGDNVDFKL